MSFDGKVRGSHHPVAMFEGSGDADNLRTVRSELRKNQDPMTSARASKGEELFQKHLLNEHSIKQTGKQDQDSSKKNSSKIFSETQRQGLVSPKKNVRPQKPMNKDSTNPSIESQIRNQNLEEKSPRNKDSSKFKTQENLLNSSQEKDGSKNEISKKDPVNAKESSSLDEKKVLSRSQEESHRSEEQGGKFEKMSQGPQASNDSTKTHQNREESLPPIDSKEAITSTKTALRSLKPNIVKTPVLSLLTGQLENLEPQAIIDIIAFNGFIQNALSEAQLESFFQKDFDLQGFLEDLDVPNEVINDLEMNGVNLAMLGTPDQFLKAMGVDVQQVRAEIQVLKDNLSLGSIEGYLTRARALADKVKFNGDKRDTNGTLISTDGLSQTSISSNNPNKLTSAKSKDLGPQIAGNPFAQGGDLDGNSLRKSEIPSNSKSEPPTTSGIKLKTPPGEFGAVVDGSQGIYQNGFGFQGGFPAENHILPKAENLDNRQPLITTANISLEINSPHQSQGFPPVAKNLQGTMAEGPAKSSSMVGQRATYDHWFYLGKMGEIEQVSIGNDSNQLQGAVLDTGSYKPFIEKNADPSILLAMNESRLSMEKSLQEDESLNVSQNPGDLSPQVESFKPTKIHENHQNYSLIKSSDHLQNDVKANAQKAVLGLPIAFLSTEDLGDTQQRPDISLDSLAFPDRGQANEASDLIQWDEQKGADIEIPDVFGGAIREDSSKSGFSHHQHDSLFARDATELADSGLSVVERSQLIRKIFDSAQSLAINGGGQIQLNIPETPWGRLDISIQMIENQLSIRISGVEDALQNSLKAELNSLSSVLENRKIDLAKIEFMRPTSNPDGFFSKEHFGGSSGKNLDDHRTHREWIDDLRTQVRLSNRSLGRMYKA